MYYIIHNTAEEVNADDPRRESADIRGAPDAGLESILEFARSKVAERLRKIHPMAEIALNATTVERKDSKTLRICAPDCRHPWNSGRLCKMSCLPRLR